MVALRGPLCSQSAQGKLVGLLFKSINGKTHLGKKNMPHNPRSAPQVQRRSFLAALAQAWSISTDAERSSWNAAPRAAKVSAFHAYVRYNFMRFDEHLWPSMIHPASAPGSPPTIYGGGLKTANHYVYFRCNLISGNYPRLVGLALTAAPFTFKGPHQFHHWSCHRGPSDRRIEWDEAPAGYFYLSAVAIDKYGQASNAFAPGYVTIDD
jgi:hypothetical protein